MTSKAFTADLSELEQQLTHINEQCAANSGMGEAYDYWRQRRKTVLLCIAELRPLTATEWMGLGFDSHIAAEMAALDTSMAALKADLSARKRLAAESVTVLNMATAMNAKRRTRGDQLAALEVEGNFVQFQFLSDAALLAEAQARSLDPSLWDTAANQRYALIKALEGHQAKLNTGMLLVLPYPEAWKKEDSTDESHVSSDCGGN